MRSYEVTYIVDSTLENNAIGSTAKKYQDILTEGGCTIVAVDEIGLRQLAYPIKRRNSGVYYCVEFQTPDAAIINKAELQMRRDESILRFLTVSLDKFGVQYNADKREGKIGTIRKKVKEEIKDEKDSARRSKKGDQKAKSGMNAPSRAMKAEGKVAADAPKEVKEAAPAPDLAQAAVVADAPKKVEAKKEAAPAPEPVKAAAPAAKDDLKKIEGIGPKIEEILHNGGINTFADLAKTPADKVKELLTAAGSRFASHNPTTWGQQAQMAADGKWDELKKWQDELDGGKVVAAKSEEE